MYDRSFYAKVAGKIDTNQKLFANTKSSHGSSQSQREHTKKKQKTKNKHKSNRMIIGVTISMALFRPACIHIVMWMYAKCDLYIRVFI